MAHSTDFVIENGVLVKYTGTDAAVTIPDPEVHAIVKVADKLSA